MSLSYIPVLCRILPSALQILRHIHALILPSIAISLRCVTERSYCLDELVLLLLTSRFSQPIVRGKTDRLSLIVGVPCLTTTALLHEAPELLQPIHGLYTICARMGIGTDSCRVMRAVQYITGIWGIYITCVSNF
jgi:hypothetical protein